jgi:hypothetical protein
MGRKILAAAVVFLFVAVGISDAGLLSKVKSKAKSVGNTVSNTTLSDVAGSVKSGAKSVGNTVSNTTLSDVAGGVNSVSTKIVSTERNVLGTTVQGVGQAQGNAISAVGGAITKGSSKLGSKIKGSSN